MKRRTKSVRNRQKPTQAATEIGLTVARAVQVPVDVADPAIVVRNLVRHHAAPKAIGANVPARHNGVPNRIVGNKQVHPDVRMAGDQTNQVFAEDLRVATTRAACQARRHAVPDVMRANDSDRHSAAQDRIVGTKQVHPDVPTDRDQTNQVVAEDLQVATMRLACPARRHAVPDVMEANESDRRGAALDRTVGNKQVHPDVRMDGEKAIAHFTEDPQVATTVVCQAHRHAVPDVMGVNDSDRRGAAPPVRMRTSSHVVNLRVVGTLVILDLRQMPADKIDVKVSDRETVVPETIAITSDVDKRLQGTEMAVISVHPRIIRDPDAMTISLRRLAAVGMNVASSDPAANSLSADTAAIPVRRNIVRATGTPVISDHRIADLEQVTAMSDLVANSQSVDMDAISVRQHTVRNMQTAIASGRPIVVQDVTMATSDLVTDLRIADVIVISDLRPAVVNVTATAQEAMLPGTSKIAISSLHDDNLAVKTMRVRERHDVKAIDALK